MFLLSDVENGQMGIKELGNIYDQIIFTYMKGKQYFVRYKLYLDSWYVV